MRLKNIQKKFMRYLAHTRYKTYILKQYFLEYKQARIMQAISDKD